MHTEGLEFTEKGSGEDFIEVFHRRCLQTPKELTETWPSQAGADGRVVQLNPVSIKRNKKDFHYKSALTPMLIILFARSVEITCKETPIKL